ncbi:MAG: hypothetical protein JW913_13700 [Chitinispirillaceae bacterium]|nr:hypothetical protein [Chitinispirillaceae bacterium]
MRIVVILIFALQYPPLDAHQKMSARNDTSEVPLRASVHGERMQQYGPV